MEQIDQAELPDEDPADCWGPCSVTCGIGHRQNIDKQGRCSAVPVTQICSPRRCPLDCLYQWHIWGQCSASCDGGRQFRGPSIQRKPAHGGEPCPAIQENPCNMEECPSVPTDLTPTSVTTTTKKSTSMTTIYFTTTPVWPLDEVEEVVVEAVQSMGCTFLLVSLGLTLLVFLALRYGLLLYIME